MGKYDDITPERLRAELTRFARLVLKMEEQGVLPEKSPTLLKLLGELRQMLFAYEVRGTKRLAPPEGEAGGAGEEAQPGSSAADEATRESLRIVREAVERERRFLEDLGKGLEEPGDDAG